MSYTITEDHRSPSSLVEEIPEDYSRMADMDHLGHVSMEEKLAERFHMDIEFLKTLNPDADFSSAGTEIVVGPPREMTRIEKSAASRVDKQQGTASRLRLRRQKSLPPYPGDGWERPAPLPVRHTRGRRPSRWKPPIRTSQTKTSSTGKTMEPLTLPAGPKQPRGEASGSICRNRPTGSTARQSRP